MFKIIIKLLLPAWEDFDELLSRKFIVISIMYFSYGTTTVVFAFKISRVF